MASESPPESGTADEQKASRPPTATGDRPKKKKLKRAKLPVPKTEAEVDSPTKQTVGMLGVLGFMTLVMWALARGACNYHPPKETRVPRKVTTADLAANPKDAAIELQQRMVTHNYAGALELATGDAATFVKQEQAACDAACLSTRKALELSVLTSAVIVDANPLGATARVTSILPGGSKTYLMRVSRADAIWKATDMKPDTGVPFPAPADEPAIPVAAPFVSATPVASAAPSTSAAAHAPAAPHASAAPHAVVPAPAASH
jgi:hypothetical protein